MPIPPKGKVQQLAPLNVEVWFASGVLEERYDVNVGKLGKVYPLSFVDLLALIRARCGHQQARLEYKPL